MNEKDVSLVVSFKVNVEDLNKCLGMPLLGCPIDVNEISDLEEVKKVMVDLCIRPTDLTEFIKSRMLEDVFGEGEVSPDELINQITTAINDKDGIALMLMVFLTGTFIRIDTPEGTTGDCPIYSGKRNTCMERKMKAMASQIAKAWNSSIKE